MKRTIVLILVSFPFCLLSQQYKPAIDSLFKEYAEEGFGMVVLVSKHGAVEYQDAFGNASIELGTQMSLESKFRIGSITKQFTAVLLLRLVEEGKLNLKDPIQNYIPEFPFKDKTITIEHLLTHTSGIPEYLDWEKYHDKWGQKYAPNALMELIKDEPLEFNPGDAFEYCNSNYLLLGMVIERVTGNSYSAYLHQEIIDKIGMTHSTTEHDLNQIESLSIGYTRSNDQIEVADVEHGSWAHASGDLISTVGDLNIWYTQLFEGKIISDSTLSMALTPFVLNNGVATDYGYGWFLDSFQEEELIYHGGSMGGFYSYVSFARKSKTLTVSLVNCDCVPIEYIGRKIAAHAIGKPLIEKKRIELDAELLELYSGTYKVDRTRNFIVKKKKTHLYGFFEESPDEGYNLFATQEGTFFSHEVGYDFDFSVLRKKKVLLIITIPRTNSEPIIRKLSKK